MCFHIFRFFLHFINGGSSVIFTRNIAIMKDNTCFVTFDALVKAASAEGNWIFAILNDVTMDKELVVAGEFHDKGDAAKPIYRKFALYAQDKDHNVTARYTLTVPKMTVQSENFKMQAGTVKGDVYVEANGFTLTEDATIDGNV